MHALIAATFQTRTSHRTSSPSLTSTRVPFPPKYKNNSYLFVRCDNAPAPWSSDDAGDALRLEVPAEAQKEIDKAVGKVHAMGESPFW